MQLLVFSAGPILKERFQRSYTTASSTQNKQKETTIAAPITPAITTNTHTQQAKSSTKSTHTRPTTTNLHQQQDPAGDLGGEGTDPQEQQSTKRRNLRPQGAAQGRFFSNNFKQQQQHPTPPTHILAVLHLISLNKYVCPLILHSGKRTSSYNTIISLQIYLALATNLIIPFIEKILLLVRYNCIRIKTELFFGKFVLSSMIRCNKISIAPAAFKVVVFVSLFSLSVLSCHKY